VFLSLSKPHECEIEEMFEGELWQFKFFYRDPWHWLLDLVSDPTLAEEIVWYPSRKYLVVDGNRQRLRDEPYNSDKWWEMQVGSFPSLQPILFDWAECASFRCWTPSLPATEPLMA
jgi:hypothetical protein